MCCSLTNFSSQAGEAERVLQALSAARPDDHLVRLNAAVVRFEAGLIGLDELDHNLKKVYNSMAHHAASGESCL